ncbi:C-C motif chemokine 21b [Amia ocellicauda]|uniref:C-C motif chemokine 21b n=1 Tax=Amia ocellicauda TaxID=2972642 RepID=UPI003464C625
MHRSPKFSSFAIIMAFMTIGIAVVLAAPYRRPTKITTDCCEKVSKARIPYAITGYKRQNPLKPCVDAVIFYTDKGQICSDPEARWVEKKIRELTTLDQDLKI